MQPGPPRSTLFPYTTLFRSLRDEIPKRNSALVQRGFNLTNSFVLGGGSSKVAHLELLVPPSGGDRKSTRLNSSHVSISYAVFCLKKKTTMDQTLPFTHNPRC